MLRVFSSARGRSVGRWNGLSIQARSIFEDSLERNELRLSIAGIDSRGILQGCASLFVQKEKERNMQRISKSLAVLVLGLAVSAAATPSFAPSPSARHGRACP